MKTKLIFLLPLLWILIGCDDSDSATLNISESKFDNISASGESLTILLVVPHGLLQVINNGAFPIHKKEKTMES